MMPSSRAISAKAASAAASDSGVSGAAIVIELGFLGGREKLGENVNLHSVLKY